MAKRKSGKSVKDGSRGNKRKSQEKKQSPKEKKRKVSLGSPTSEMIECTDFNIINADTAFQSSNRVISQKNICELIDKCKGVMGSIFKKESITSRKLQESLERINKRRKEFQIVNDSKSILIALVGKTGHGKSFITQQIFHKLRELTFNLRSHDGTYIRTTCIPTLSQERSTTHFPLMISTLPGNKVILKKKKASIDLFRESCQNLKLNLSEENVTKEMDTLKEEVVEEVILKEDLEFNGDSEKISKLAKKIFTELYPEREVTNLEYLSVLHFELQVPESFTDVKHKIQLFDLPGIPDTNESLIPVKTELNRRIFKEFKIDILLSFLEHFPIPLETYLSLFSMKVFEVDEFQNSFLPIVVPFRNIKEKTTCVDNIVDVCDDITETFKKNFQVLLNLRLDPKYQEEVYDNKNSHSGGIDVSDNDGEFSPLDYEIYRKNIYPEKICESFKRFQGYTYRNWSSNSEYSIIKDMDTVNKLSKPQDITLMPGRIKATIHLDDHRSPLVITVENGQVSTIRTCDIKAIVISSEESETSEEATFQLKLKNETTNPLIFVSKVEVALMLKNLITFRQSFSPNLIKQVDHWCEARIRDLKEDALIYLWTEIQHFRYLFIHHTIKYQRSFKFPKEFHEEFRKLIDALNVAKKKEELCSMEYLIGGTAVEKIKCMKPPKAKELISIVMNDGLQHVQSKKTKIFESVIEKISNILNRIEMKSSGKNLPPINAWRGYIGQMENDKLSKINKPLKKNLKSWQQNIQKELDEFPPTQSIESYLQKIERSLRTTKDKSLWSYLKNLHAEILGFFESPASISNVNEELVNWIKQVHQNIDHFYTSRMYNQIDISSKKELTVNRVTHERNKNYKNINHIPSKITSSIYRNKHTNETSSNFPVIDMEMIIESCPTSKSGMRDDGYWDKTIEPSSYHVQFNFNCDTYNRIIQLLREECEISPIFYTLMVNEKVVISEENCKVRFHLWSSGFRSHTHQQNQLFFFLVEPSEVEVSQKYLKSFFDNEGTTKKESMKIGSNIEKEFHENYLRRENFVIVKLPFNNFRIGRAKTAALLLAKSFKIPRFWIISENIDTFCEYYPMKISGTPVTNSTFFRSLKHGEKIFDYEIERGLRYDLKKLTDTKNKKKEMREQEISGHHDNVRNSLVEMIINNKDNILNPIIAAIEHMKSNRPKKFHDVRRCLLDMESAIKKITCITSKNLSVLMTCMRNLIESLFSSREKLLQDCSQKSIDSPGKVAQQLKKIRDSNSQIVDLEMDDIDDDGEESDSEIIFLTPLSNVYIIIYENYEKIGQITGEICSQIAQVGFGNYQTISEEIKKKAANESHYHSESPLESCVLINVDATNQYHYVTDEIMFGMDKTSDEKFGESRVKVSEIRKNKFKILAVEDKTYFEKLLTLRKRCKDEKEFKEKKQEWLNEYFQDDKKRMKRTLASDGYINDEIDFYQAMRKCGKRIYKSVRHVFKKPNHLEFLRFPSAYVQERNSLLQKTLMDENYWYECNDIQYLIDDMITSRNLQGKVGHFPPIDINQQNDEAKFCIRDFIKHCISEKQDYCFFPLQINGNHWVLLVVKIGSKNKVQSMMYIDPRGDRIDENDRVVFGFLEDDLECKISESTGAYQKDDYSCGTWIVYFVEQILSTNKIPQPSHINGGEFKRIRKSHMDMLKERSSTNNMHDNYIKEKVNSIQKECQNHEEIISEKMLSRSLNVEHSIHRRLFSVSEVQFLGSILFDKEVLLVTEEKKCEEKLKSLLIPNDNCIIFVQGLDRYWHLFVLLLKSNQSQILHFNPAKKILLPKTILDIQKKWGIRSITPIQGVFFNSADMNFVLSAVAVLSFAEYLFEKTGRTVFDIFSSLDCYSNILETKYS